MIDNRLKEGNSLGEINNGFSASQKCRILGGKKESMHLRHPFHYHATEYGISYTTS